MPSAITHSPSASWIAKQSSFIGLTRPLSEKPNARSTANPPEHPQSAAVACRAARREGGSQSLGISAAGSAVNSGSGSDGAAACETNGWAYLLIAERSIFAVSMFRVLSFVPSATRNGNVQEKSVADPKSTMYDGVKYFLSALSTAVGRLPFSAPAL